MVNDLVTSLQKKNNIIMIIGFVYPLLIIIPTIILALVGFDPVIYLMVLGSSMSSTIVFHSIMVRKHINKLIIS